MGLLNDFFNSAKGAVDGVQNNFNSREINNRQTNNNNTNPDYDCPTEALPPRLVSATSLQCKECRFMISQDFIEDDIYDSSLIAFKYNPGGFFNEDEITISLHEVVSDFPEIYDALVSFEQSGNVSNADEFVKFEDGKYLFKAKLSSDRYKEYFYVIRDDQYEEAMDYRLLLLLYTNDIVNTKLEQKLVSCFEDVVNSYEEIN